MRIQYLLIVLLFPCVVYAQIFGPRSFEECMSDGKTGRTSAELSIKENECRKRFPKLSALAKRSDKPFQCVLPDNRTVTFRYFHTKKQIRVEDSIHTVLFINDEKIVFREDSVGFQTTINYLRGSGFIEVKDSIVAGLSCHE